MAYEALVFGLVWYSCLWSIEPPRHRSELCLLTRFTLLSIHQFLLDSAGRREKVSRTSISFHLCKMFSKILTLVCVCCFTSVSHHCVHLSHSSCLFPPLTLFKHCEKPKHVYHITGTILLYVLCLVTWSKSKTTSNLKPAETSTLRRCGLVVLFVLPWAET